VVRVCVLSFLKPPIITTTFFLRTCRKLTTHPDIEVVGARAGCQQVLGACVVGESFLVFGSSLRAVCFL
jgi:hypothetical protein